MYCCTIISFLLPTQKCTNQLIVRLCPVSDIGLPTVNEQTVDITDDVNRTQNYYISCLIYSFEYKSSTGDRHT